MIHNESVIIYFEFSQVHRLVLLAACPYLLTIGGQHDVPVLEVKLPMSVGLEGLNVFLTYLYDGTLHLTTSNLISVEKISKILRVAGIKKFCQEFRRVNESVILKDGIGTSDKFATDYSLKMTNNSIQIIFSETSCNESFGIGNSCLKREAVESESFGSENKRRRMNIESLSPVLQHQNTSSITSSRIQNPMCSDQSSINSSRLSKTSHGAGDEDHSSSSSDLLPSEQGVRIKQEPQEEEESHESGMFVTPSGDHDNSLSTDFVQRAPYNTQAFPSLDEDSGTSSSHSLPTPASTTLADSGVNHPSTLSKYDAPVTYLSESNQPGDSSSRNDSHHVLKKAVQSLAADTSVESGANEQMRLVSLVYQGHSCYKFWSSV